MAFVINSFDEKKQEEGIWVEFAGSEFLVAASKNTRYVKALTRLQKPYAKQIERKTLGNETAERILCEALAEGILLGWKDVYDAAGKPVEYNKEIAAEALQADGEFREFVLETASNAEAFKLDNIKEVTKK